MEQADPKDLPSTQALPPPLAEAPTVQLKVAVGPRGAGQATTDIQLLLRKRLLFLALLHVVLGCPSVLGSFLLGAHWFVLAVLGSIFVVTATLAAILWKIPLLSLRQLRVMELVLFGTIFAFWIYAHAGVYPYFRLSNPPDWFSSIMAYAISLPWFSLILVYGIFIPNTWRRCAAVVGTAAMIPMLISLTTGLAANASGGHGQGPFWFFMGLWMTVAVALAIYGSHRIEVLRQEVSAARKLGQYQLKQRLGAGGMGEVYLAEHMLLRRPCAIKLIHPDRAADPSYLLRFEREVQATATLTHPNTVQIFDYGHAADGTFYYAMEYLPGLNLQDLVERHGPLPPERGVYLLRQVCGALREAHAIGLIHRDIKPTNILVCERGGLQDVVKLLDFGLVQAPEVGKSDGKLTQVGSILGTPAFMSPEQANGTGKIDARSDIYSLGVVAYFLLTGALPFKGTSAIQLLAAHLYEPVPPLRNVRPDLPADLEEVILLCLEKDPAQRFPDAESLDQALAHCQCVGDWNWHKAAGWWQSRGGEPTQVSEATE